MSFSNPPRYSAETARAYVTALLDLLGDRDPILVMGATAEQLTTSTEVLPPELATQPEKEGKWSVVEVVQHLVDSEIVYGYRMRLIVAEDEPGIPGYDQNAWASNLRYIDVSLADALRDFEALRSMNLRWLSGLSESELDRWGLHSERGKESVRHIVKLLAAHDLVHLRQVERIKSAVAG
ncbi:MAG: DinB family protein [Rubricoccaceae bacterium]|nr:DinB family protein [Rubricoccaceae bacterium]